MYINTDSSCTRRVIESGRQDLKLDDSMDISNVCREGWPPRRSRSNDSAPKESLLSRYVNGLKVAFPTKRVTTVCRNECPKSEVQIIDFTFCFENILISIFRVNNTSVTLSLIKNCSQKEVLKLCHRESYLAYLSYM